MELSLRLSLVISSLDSGGAERVMSTLANYWIEQEHDITLVTLNPFVPDFYKISSKIEHVRLSRKRIKTGGWTWLEKSRIPFRLRAALKRSEPDVIVAFIDQTNVLTLLATLGMATPVVISERIDPRASQIRPLWRILRRWTYPRASALVVQTTGVSKWASSLVRPHKVHVIANPIESVSPVGTEISVPLPPAPFALAVGRLVPQKGFDLLIQAFATCLRRQPKWQLVIAGKGPQEDHLKGLARDLRISESVHFIGVTAHLWFIYQKSSLFVLSSRFEGFPNALVEAMAAGLPAIATDCPSGPREIVTHEVDGLLVRPDDIEDLQRSMERLMSDRDLAARIGRQATKVTERFSLNAIGDRWEQLFNSLHAP